jgi:hypothetical protein
MKDSIDKDSLPQEGRKRWLSVKGLGWRIFMGLAFTLILTVFLQMREVRIEMVEADSVSKQYVVAQSDFEFPDDAKTEFLQQQAMLGSFIASILKKLRKQVVNSRNF